MEGLNGYVATLKDKGMHEKLDWLACCGLGTVAVCLAALQGCRSDAHGVARLERTVSAVKREPVWVRTDLPVIGLARHGDWTYFLVAGWQEAADRGLPGEYGSPSLRRARAQGGALVAEDPLAEAHQDGSVVISPYRASILAGERLLIRFTARQL